MKTRRQERLTTQLSILARVPAVHVAVTLLDISTSGCRIETDSELAQVGATILLTFSDQFEAAGEVAWRKEGECGVKFHKDIPEETVDRIAALVN